MKYYWQVNEKRKNVKGYNDYHFLVDISLPNENKNLHCNVYSWLKVPNGKVLYR